MIIVLLILFLLLGLFGLGFVITGALIKAVLWLFVFLPVGLFLLILAMLCCCTILLIPLGIILFKAGVRVIIPL